MISIVMFSTSTCTHCKPMKQTLTQFAENNSEITLDVKVVDQDAKAMASFREFGLQGVPTTIFFKDAEEIGRIVGNEPLSAVEAIVASAEKKNDAQENTCGIHTGATR